MGKSGKVSDWLGRNEGGGAEEREEEGGGGEEEEGGNEEVCCERSSDKSNNLASANMSPTHKRDMKSIRFTQEP